MICGHSSRRPSRRLVGVQIGKIEHQVVGVATSQVDDGWRVGSGSSQVIDLLPDLPIPIADGLNTLLMSYSLPAKIEPFGPTPEPHCQNQ